MFSSVCVSVCVFMCCCRVSVVVSRYGAEFLFNPVPGLCFTFNAVASHITGVDGSESTDTHTHKQVDMTKEKRRKVGITKNQEAIIK